jgi:hypothetical protein
MTRALEYRAPHAPDTQHRHPRRPPPGRILLRYYDRVDQISIETKSRNDFVSEVDRSAEAAIIQELRAKFPDHAILAEEGGAQGEGDFQWIIDPLDGTTNYLHGFPQFSISIALRHRGQPEQAVVYDPLREELFTASPRPRGPAQRPPPAGEQPPWAGGGADRDRLPLPGPAPHRRLSGDVQGHAGGHRRAAPPGLRGAGFRLCGGRAHWTASGSSGSPPGTSPPGPC